MVVVPAAMLEAESRTGRDLSTTNITVLRPIVPTAVSACLPALTVTLGVPPRWQSQTRGQVVSGGQPCRTRERPNSQTLICNADRASRRCSSALSRFSSRWQTPCVSICSRTQQMPPAGHKTPSD